MFSEHLSPDQINQQFNMKKLNGTLIHLQCILMNVDSTLDQDQSRHHYILKENAPKVETLATFLAEVEFVLNSRQLAFASMDLDDPARITPNHLLLGKRVNLMSPGQLTF
jgi:hypothetical protein